MIAPAATFADRVLRLLPLVLCVAAIAVDIGMIDLKGISTDEGFRLGIVNGGHAFIPHPHAPWPSFGDVLRTVEPHAYQPGYYLFLNSLMRVFGRQDLFFFRIINVGVLAICLAGLLSLSRDWPGWPRAFLIGSFAFNAYLSMHVLQIREYILAVAIYIWGTYLVLHLDRRVLTQVWADIGCFAGYGLLLCLGFYVQTWTVFPAIAQGIFLVFRKRHQQLRLLAHLALSYLVVVALVWPYLRANPQKVNVGLWEREKVTLFGQLANGFHLVLTGHTVGHSWFTSLLPLVWLTLVVSAAWLLWRRRGELPAYLAVETTRQVYLMLLSCLIPLAFQIGYYYLIEPLSVWPRYFIVHYFFLYWLIALAFRLLHANIGPATYRPLLATASILLACSAVYQVSSYWRDPYFDTSTSANSNWRVIARALQGLLRPDDIVLSSDFVTRSTLSATCPVPNPSLTLQELETADLSSAPRLIYVESASYRLTRSDLLRRMANRGYPRMQEWQIPAGDNSGPVPDWCLLTFSLR